MESAWDGVGVGGELQNKKTSIVNLTARKPYISTYQTGHLWRKDGGKGNLGYLLYVPE